MEYFIEKGVVQAEKDIPYLPRWFAEDRLAFGVDQNSIIGIDYWNKNTKGSEKVLYADFWGGIKPMIVIDNKNYFQNLKNVRLYPFGVYADWCVNDYVFQYKQITVNNSIIISLIPKAHVKNLSFQISLYNSMRLEPHKQTDVRYHNAEVRNWTDWKKENGMMCCSFKESCGETAICIATSIENKIVQSAQWSRYIIKCSNIEKNEECVFVLSFDCEEKASPKKALDLVDNYKKYEKKLLDLYSDIQKDMPQLKSGNNDLDHFMQLAPMYSESLKIRDYAGAMRAKTTYYWVWGWDGLTCNEATAYWGRCDFIKSILDFYMTHCDISVGIPHKFSKTMEAGEISAVATQGMYISLLYIYFCNGGDIIPYYNFLRDLFELVCRKIVGNTGMFSEKSLFPDFPENMLETGDDISGFNNTVFYCAVRAMEIIASVAGDIETAQKSYEISQQIERSFVKLFFDDEKGYIVSSVDAKTLKKRNCYNANSVKWENNFCSHLTDRFDDRALEFFEKNIVTDMGLREIPAWCDAYDTDANQLHCWWPVTGEYYARLINKFGRKDLINKWIKWVSFWTKRLMCPEGISCLVETETPDFDGWNCQSGTWQAYSMRGWYAAAVHAVIGVNFDFGGMTVKNWNMCGASIKNICWKNCRYNINIEGKGEFTKEIVANGNILKHTNVIPFDMQKKENEIKIVKQEGKNDVVKILDAYGIQIIKYKENNTSIEFTAVGYGHQRISVSARKELEVIVGGKKTILKENEHIKIDFTTEREKNIIILFRQL